MGWLILLLVGVVAVSAFVVGVMMVVAAIFLWWTLKAIVALLIWLVERLRSRSSGDPPTSSGERSYSTSSG